MSLADALEEYEIHLDVCWQTVSDYICQDLLHGEQTTYTECCCRLGEAWGQNCALCPHRASGEWGSKGKHPTVHSEGAPIEGVGAPSTVISYPEL